MALYGLLCYDGRKEKVVLEFGGNDVKKRWKRRFAFLLVLVSASVLCGCGKGKGGIRFTTGLGDKELFKLEDEVCTKQEAMIFILSQKARYENLYGKDIWSVRIQEQTFSEYMRDKLQDFLAKMKCMVLMAEEYGVELSEEETLKVSQAAETYFSGLSPDVIEATGIRQTDAETVFHDYYISSKLIKQLTADVSAEISEDEARVIIIQQIFINTDGLSAEEKEGKRTEAAQVKAQADAGADFAGLAKARNEAEEFELHVARGDTEAQFEEAAFQLSSGQISDVIETKYGFHIIKCIDNYEEQETAEHKAKLARKCKEDKFYEYYDAFVKTIVARYNKKAWQSIDYQEELPALQTDFYEVYNQYFEESI